jgi:glutamyl-tRNA reductase
MPSKELHVLGVSFRTAPAAVREALSFGHAEAGAFLAQAVGEAPGLEALVLSTCNRVEFWLAAPEGYDVRDRFLGLLRRVRPAAPILRPECVRYEHAGADAVRHLARVACGLDSAILGDVQIRRQVKDAADTARRSRALGPYLEQALTAAFRASRRAHQETAIGRGAASVGSAAAGMVAERLRETRGGRVLVVGAGEAARNIGRHLVKRGLGPVTFVNRTASRAREVAAHCGGRVRDWAELPAALLDADVVIVAIGASRVLLHQSLLARTAAARPHRPLLVVDASLPRCVEEGSAVEVVGIDAIRERHTQHLAIREAAVPLVEAIVQGEVRAWVRWRDGLPLEALIKQLYGDLDAISREAAGPLAAGTTLPVAEAEAIVQRCCRRLLHGHVRRLRALAAV